MAQKNRSKELWLVPKRNSLHQTVCLIDGIIERGYDGQSWNEQKQNNLGVNLKKWGATKSGKNISNQSIRTLLASIPEYLGFVYINRKTTPNSLCLTPAGRLLWETHKDQLMKIKNLGEAGQKLLDESVVVLHQMEKLQLTNPLFLKDCENILVFPFRLTLKLLRRLGYLDREEIAYFVLQIKDESQFELKVKEIEHFRKMSYYDRKEIIDAFKETHIGNITLVKASSASYFEGLCALTGIVERYTAKPSNCASKLNCIRIKLDCEGYVNEILDKKYASAKPYDFKGNVGLWIDYIGNPQQLLPPFDVKIENATENDFLLQVFKGNKIKDADIVKQGDSVFYPLFVGEKYIIKLVDTQDAGLTNEFEIVPTIDCLEFSINNVPITNKPNKDKNYFASLITEHLASSSFAKETLDYLTILFKNLNIDKRNDSSLRGAYFEYYMYEYLAQLKNEGAIDDVIWNGRIGKYGLPVSAPGGRLGEPDIVFIKNGVHYVLELTTIKSKSLQEKVEIASVSDHIKLYSEKVANKVVGLFCAPVIHPRNVAVVNNILKEGNLEFNAFTEKELFDYISRL